MGQAGSGPKNAHRQKVITAARQRRERNQAATTSAKRWIGARVSLSFAHHPDDLRQQRVAADASARIRKLPVPLTIARQSRVTRCSFQQESARR